MASEEDFEELARKEMEEFERMERMILERERAHVDEVVTSQYAAMRIGWEANTIEGGSADSIVVAACAPIAVNGGHMKESAGHAFHEAARVKLGMSAVCEAKLARKASIEAMDQERTDDSVDFDAPEFKMKKTKRRGNKEFPDHYGALGLATRRYLATADEIKEKHRWLTIALHPDKMGVAQVSEAEAERIEQRYKAVVIAMEVLLDKGRRKEYDSVDAPEFNFPSKCEEGEFYETFMPHFQLLSRFSETKPVPICDDPDAEYEDVRKHYIFWAAKFKSWREFPQDKESDVETAHDRDHRRQMEKENKKLRADAKKKESAQIRAFVEAAQKYDPRCIKQREAEKAARDAKKMGRTDSARALAEADAKAKAEAEAAAAVAAEKAKADKANAKKELDKLKKALRKDKQRLRAIGAAAEGWIDYPGDGELESICDSLNVDHAADLKKVLDGAMNGDEPKGPWDCVAAVLAAGALADSAKWGAKVEEAAGHRSEREATETVGGDWSADEVAELETASKQLFPLGAVNRWDSVSAHMAEKGKSRTAMDCLVKGRTLA